LRSLLGLDQQKTDYELAVEQDQQAFELTEIARAAWAIVCKKNKRGELLEVASTGSIDILIKYLKFIGAL
jgi:hypothetical protein